MILVLLWQSVIVRVFFSSSDYNRTRDERILPIRTSGIIKKKNRNKIKLTWSWTEYDWQISFWEQLFIDQSIVHFLEKKKTTKLISGMSTSCLSKYSSSIYMCYAGELYEQLVWTKHHYFIIRLERIYAWMVERWMYIRSLKHT